MQFCKHIKVIFEKQNIFIEFYCKNSFTDYYLFAKLLRVKRAKQKMNQIVGYTKSAMTEMPQSTRKDKKYSNCVFLYSYIVHTGFMIDHKFFFFGFDLE